jgi:hypothetical protein
MEAQRTTGARQHEDTARADRPVADAFDDEDDGGPAALDGNEEAETDEELDAAVGGSNVRVIVRVRPLLEHEVQSAHSCSLLHIGNERVRAAHSDAAGASASSLSTGHISVQAKESVHRFSFDAVLTPQHTQRDVFEAGKVGRMLHALLKGYHGTIFGWSLHQPPQQQG